MAARTLPIEEMYRVLRGLPGVMTLAAPNGETFALTVVNPNAPANRCQETLGLALKIDGPLESSEPRCVERKLSQEELDILRDGECLALDMDGVQLSLRSNPGGRMVLLDAAEDVTAPADLGR